MSHWQPIPDRTAARVLGRALRDAGYSEAGLTNLLGDEAYEYDRDEGPVAERRLPDTRLGVVIRAFFLQLPIAVREASRAIGRAAVEALEATALAEVGDNVVPRVRIVPVGELLVASDDFPDENGVERADYVAAYTPTSRICDSLTPRRRVERALDVGCGSGVQALLAARHAERVIATDVNPRALAYTELNAALNGFTNIECRRGSLFEPVADEHFDLITSNSPYVVSPENRLVYRDAGFRGDELSEQIVRGAAEHLTDHGFASLLVSWIADDEDAPDERPLAWVEPFDGDAWILPVWGSDPIAHAATWNETLAGDDEAFRSALDEWMDYLADVGARWVTEGAVLLHRRPGSGYTIRIDEIDDETLEDAGAQVERAFDARARLSGVNRSAALLDAPLLLATRLTLAREVGPQDGRAVTGAGRVELSAGTRSSVDTTAQALEVLAALDGRTALADVIQATAGRLRLADAESTRLRREALRLSRELLELGALRLD